MTTQEFYKIFKKDKDKALDEFLKMPLEEQKNLVLEMITKGVNTCRNYLRLKHTKDRGNVPVSISKSLEEKVIFYMGFFEAMHHEFENELGKDFIKEKDFNEEYWRELQELCAKDKKQ